MVFTFFRGHQPLGKSEARYKPATLHVPQYLKYCNFSTGQCLSLEKVGHLLNRNGSEWDSGLAEVQLGLCGEKLVEFQRVPEDKN